MSDAPAELFNPKNPWTLLRERYLAPEWAIFFEVANGPGSLLRRYADAIAMSLFPSRGLDIHGFEVKVNRGDWIKELKQPEKAEEIAQFCDFWWVVAGGDDVVKLDEVPKNWGLLVSNGKELRQKKKCERLEPQPLSRKFVAALLRRAHEWMEKQIRDDERVNEAREKAYEEGRKSITDNRTATALEELSQAVRLFEEKSGVEITTYDAGQMGEAVKAFLYARDNDLHEAMEHTAEMIERDAKLIRERAAVLRAQLTTTKKGGV